MTMHRILFVDDERPVLDGLRQSLYRARSQWNMTFVDSAQLAIAALESGPFDVIVTDVRMPVMDGARLLEIVSQRWPATARIVLSGDADLKQLTHLVPLAHQYINKPCQSAQIEQVIAQCIRVQGTLNAPGLRNAIGKIRRLPMCPKIYQRLTEAMSRDNSEISEIAAIISLDGAVTAKLLQVVNSAFFRLPRRIATIEQAVAHLGLQSVRNLVICAEIFCEWTSARAPQGLEPAHLQLHAQAVAAAAKSLGQGYVWRDEAMLAGLLHDIGYWVLTQQCAEEMAHACEMARTRGITLYEAEREVLGATHAEVGAYLLGLWGLPYPVLETVAFHHDAAMVAKCQFGIFAAVALAEMLAGHAMQPNEQAPLACPEYFASLNAPMDWTEVQRRVGQALNSEA